MWVAEPPSVWPASARLVDEASDTDDVAVDEVGEPDAVVALALVEDEAFAGEPGPVDPPLADGPLWDEGPPDEVWLVGTPALAEPAPPSSIVPAPGVAFCTLPQPSTTTHAVPMAVATHGSRLMGDSSKAAGRMRATRGHGR
ncbi:MAG: hypothetical protein ABSC94_03215 [Polyangiaceae bacterium]